MLESKDWIADRIVDHGSQVLLQDAFQLDDRLLCKYRARMWMAGPVLNGKVQLQNFLLYPYCERKSALRGVFDRFAQPSSQPSDIV